MANNEVDTYYDYDERQWKSRRLGGGPIRRGPVCPTVRTAASRSTEAVTMPAPDQRRVTRANTVTA
jgi:hypothetical protein